MYGQVLESGYRVRRVRGNGHCLFSSIATHLMSTERLVALQKRLPGAEDQRIIGLSIQQLKEGKSVEAILQDEAMYASWVKLLRIRAVEWWGKKIHESGEKLEGLALAAREAIPELRDNSNDREVCDQYLRTMSAMVEIKYGGSPEIQALEGVLGMSIHPVDLKQIAELGLSRVPPPSSADHDVWILYKGSHFDSLLPPIAIP